jgi:2Fe-2S ferredoxin
VPQIVILPHPLFCPEGAVLEAPEGKSVCDVMLDNDIDIEHACDRVCACTTCHVLVREGYATLGEPEEKEEDIRQGLNWKRCRAVLQAIVGTEDLVVEIPKYTINHAAEKNH